MRLFTLLLISPLFPGLGSAQLVLSATDFPSPIGSSYVLHSVIPAPDLPTHERKVWDFKELQISNSQGVNVTSTEDSPLGGLFSESEICHSLGGGNYLFSKKTDRSLLKYGGVAKSTELVMTDPEEYFRFPLEKGQEWKDDFASTFTSQGLRFIRQGKLKGNVRGECAIILPYGSIHDVLHITLKEELTDEYEVLGNQMVQNTINLIECFVKTENSSPILTWTRVLVNGKQVSSYISFPDESFVKGKDSDGPWNSFSIEQSIGTAGSQLKFNSEWSGILTMEFLDDDGNVSRTMELITKPGPMEVDVPYLDGTEYLRLRTDGQSILIPTP